MTAIIMEFIDEIMISRVVYLVVNIKHITDIVFKTEEFFKKPDHTPLEHPCLCL